MPEGSRVDDCYEKLRREGHSEESAARICQSSTGEALETGRAPKDKSDEDDVRQLAKLPLGELRRRQNIADQQSQTAYQQGATAALQRIQHQRQLLNAAVNLREFGGKSFRYVGKSKTGGQVWYRS